MGILQFPTPIPATNGVAPSLKFMVSTDNLATVTGASYLNTSNLDAAIPVSNTDVIMALYSYNIQSTSGTFGIFSVAISNGVITLSLEGAAGEVTLPTIANHLMVSTNVSGNLANLTGTAINGGSLQAGLSGTAGTLISYPATATKGSLIVAGVANTGNTNTTISNAAMGQATVVSIPDPGVSSTSFLLLDSAGTQVIRTGNLALTVGNFNVVAGTAQVGSNGFLGNFTAYSATPNSGHILINPTANSGNYITTITNASMGQPSVITIPDPTTSTADFVLAPAALVNGNLVQASGTAGLVVDSGISGASIATALKSQTAIVTMTAAQVIAAYATPFLIVAAPASGFALMPTACQIITVVSTAFTSGGIAQLQWGNTNHAGGTVALDATTPTAEITAATSQIYTQYGVPTTTVTAIATANGLGLYFTNATQAFATGTGSTVTIAVTYMTVPV